MQSRAVNSASKLAYAPKLKRSMDMKRNLWVTFILSAAMLAGCSKVGERTDAQIQSDVQSKISADNNVPDKQLNISAAGGVVTLSGNVSSDAARNAAGNDAGQIAGVK